jgi:hypothetical protein
VAPDSLCHSVPNQHGITTATRYLAGLGAALQCSDQYGCGCEKVGRRGPYSGKVRQRPQHQPRLRPTNFVAQIPSETKHRFSREFAKGQSAAAIDGVRLGWSGRHLPTASARN